MRKLKPVIQKDFKDCGVSCIQYIIMYYGGYISLEKLREDTYTSKDGTTAYHIVNTFQKWNFDSIGILEYDLYNLNLKYPLIAHLKLENGLEHFVVINKIKKNNVYLMDPGIGYKKMNMNDFKKIFTGHIILANPRDNVIKMNEGLTINNLFWNIICKEKSLIFKIIITSILWTICSIVCSYYLKIGSKIINNDFKLIKYVIMIFLLLTLIKIIMYYVRIYYENHLSILVDLHIYPEFIRHLFYLPLKSIRSRTNGEIMTRVEEVANIKALFTDILVSTSLDLLLVIVSIISLYLINNKLLNILVVFIVIYSLYGYINSKIIYKKVLENINYKTNFNSVVMENILMFESIKNLKIEEKILNKIERSLSKYLKQTFSFNNFFNLSNLGKDFLLEMCFFIINSYGFISVYKNNLSIVDLFTFNLIISYCIEPIKNVINILPKYNYIKATFNKMTEFINIDEEKIYNKNQELKGDIILKDISFSYNNYNYILNNFNCVIKHGSHILLDGDSGVGKSTICKLIYQEYYPNKGEIYIGNNNLKDLEISTIRENILYVSQNENLFMGTIKENILAYREIDENLFDDICKICELESIVSKKSLRYNSLVEPASKNISGGEAQRIILARGLLKKCNILILDEALSEVDKKLEMKIIKNIKNYFKDKTIIYISHKNQEKVFSTILKIGENNELL